MKKAYLTLDPPRASRTAPSAAPACAAPRPLCFCRVIRSAAARCRRAVRRGLVYGPPGHICDLYRQTPGGADIAVTSSGMGCACVAAALEELAAAGRGRYPCGHLRRRAARSGPGTIVIASGCVRGEGASYELVPPEFPAVADPLLVRALCSAAQELDEPVRVGLYRSHDAFYMESKAAHPGLRERMQKWIDTGVLVVENEVRPAFHLWPPARPSRREHLRRARLHVRRPERQRLRSLCRPGHLARRIRNCHAHRHARSRAAGGSK